MASLILSRSPAIQRIRREEKSERKPSGCPFAFKKGIYKHFWFVNTHSSLPKILFDKLRLAEWPAFFVWTR